MPSPAEFRTGLAMLTRMAELDLAAAYRTASDGVAARNLLRVVLPELTSVYGSASASLAADWYDDMRDTAEVSGRFRAIAATLPDAGRTEALAGYAVGPLFRAEPDFASSLTLAQGGLQRIVANAARETVMGSAIEDDGARGWKRVGVGANCSYCDKLIGYGAVYTTRGAKFTTHDHCNCYSAPEFVGAAPITATRMPEPELPVAIAKPETEKELKARRKRELAEALERGKARMAARKGAAAVPAPAPKAAESFRAFKYNNDGAAWGNRAFADWQAEAAADPDTLRAFNDYVMGSNGPWNRSMRGWDGAWVGEAEADQMRAVAKALDKARLPDAVELRRDSASLIDYEPGMTFKDDGFISTTVGPQGAWNDTPYHFVIEAPADTKGAYLGRQLSGWDDTIQAEVILAPGTEFEVISVTQETGRKVVRARVKSQDDLGTVLERIDNTPRSL